ncbi:IS5 family transposase [Burkholderia multivorans]|nr:IS5 family transposase [Burkholderia multivorans]
MANEALAKMDRLFAEMYEADIKGGRPSIAPEKLLRAMLIQVLYSIRSERQLMEQVQYNLLFRWFIGLAMDDEVWVPTVFTKNRERLIKHDAVVEFFNEVVAVAEKKCLLSGEHFSVDGTLIQAWAGHKSFVRKNGDDQDNDGSGAGDFKGEKRSNETHQSRTDPDAQLYRKGKTASELRYMGHTLTDRRLLNWGASVGPGAEAVVRHLLTNKPHPEMGYRACLGLLSLARKYGKHRLEAACQRALKIGSPTRRSVLSILEAGLDLQPSLPTTPAEWRSPEHENVRGPDYYH